MKQPKALPGTTVQINGGIAALLLRVSIGVDDIEYQVAWWNEGSRHTCWLTEAENRL